jgi:hypothetical protein
MRTLEFPIALGFAIAMSAGLLWVIWLMLSGRFLELPKIRCKARVAPFGGYEFFRAASSPIATLHDATTAFWPSPFKRMWHGL